LVNGIRPIDHIDRLAMYHDLEYLRGNFDKSDLSAIYQSSQGLASASSLAMKYGLTARLMSRYQPQDIYVDLDKDELYDYGKRLADAL